MSMRDTLDGCQRIINTQSEELSRYREALQKIAAKYDESRWKGGFGVSAGDLAAIAREALGEKETR